MAGWGVNLLFLTIAVEILIFIWFRLLCCACGVVGFFLFGLFAPNRLRLEASSFCLIKKSAKVFLVFIWIFLRYVAILSWIWFSISAHVVPPAFAFVPVGLAIPLQCWGRMSTEKEKQQKSVSKPWKNLKILFHMRRPRRKREMMKRTKRAINENEGGEEEIQRNMIKRSEKDERRRGELHILRPTIASAHTDSRSNGMHRGAAESL